jgi:hypothetical protein
MMARMNRRILAASLGTLIALLALTAAAVAKTYNIPASLGSALTSTDAKTPLAILIPSRLALDFDGRVFASGGGGSTAYDLSLAGARNCGGANACFLASFEAQRGGKPGFKRRVALRGGRTGHFKPLTCGGSCSPPLIQWVQRGNLYTIRAKVPDSTDAGQRRRLVAAANSAIAAGPR